MPVVSAGIIAMAIILALVVLCIIVLLVIMKKREICIFKKSLSKHDVTYSPGREVTFTGLDSAGQRVFDMENAQNGKSIYFLYKHDQKYFSGVVSFIYL